MLKRGNIVMENLVFIILNLVFFSILVLFIFTKMSSSFVLEERTAKGIALMIDSAKPGTLIRINFEEQIKSAEKEKREKNSIVNIVGNVVNVNIAGKKGYSYGFFNDVEVNKYFDESSLVLRIEEKNSEVNNG